MFGVFTLLLACVGIHGMTSYSVARRTGEIGIRLALGASRPQVLWMVFRQLLLPVGAGVLIGVPIAWLVSPVASTFLFELHPRDPVTIGAAAAIIVVVAIVAGVRPARRAARMQAVAALRSE
jgi:ABC-type antimicrobial peptide transport system permease subunit